MDPDGGSEGGMKASDSGDALKVDPTGLAVDQKWGVRKKEATRMAPKFLGSAVKGVALSFTDVEEAAGGSVWG